MWDIIPARQYEERQDQIRCDQIGLDHVLEKLGIGYFSQVQPLCIQAEYGGRKSSAGEKHQPELLSEDNYESSGKQKSCDAWKR